MPDKDAGTPRVFLVRHGAFMKSLLILDRGVPMQTVVIATAHPLFADTVNLMPICKRVPTVHLSPNLGGNIPRHMRYCFLCGFSEL
jgi:hypothetical protein